MSATLVGINSAMRAAACLVLCVAGCTWVGPEIIRSGRSGYNDAILATSDQQLLQNIVRMRFGDSVGFLTVSSVTANVTFTTSATVDLGYGAPQNYAGALIPFSGNIASEQNPTISYTPVGGDRVLRQLASETPIDLTVLLVSSAHSQRAAFTAIVRRVNDIRNPDFVDPPSLVADPRFDEIATLLETLQRRGILYWVKLGGAESGYGIVLHSYNPHSSREVNRLIDLTAVKKPLRDGDDVVIPLRLSAGSPAPGTIAIETRSLFDLVRLAAASIELPRDAAAGATTFGKRGPAGDLVQIRSSTFRPKDSRAVCEYRGRFYYIDQNDESTKQWFTMLGLLASAQVPDTGVAPLLTVPVAGKR